jgi:hypothetical protein
VVPTIPYDVLINLFIGLWIPFCARKQLRNEASIYGNPYFEFALLYQIFIFLPVSFYLYLKYPAWSWMYFLDPGEIPAYSVAITFLSYPMAMLIGYGYAAKGARRDQIRPIYSAMGATLFGLAMLVISTLRRLWTVASYADYHQGSGVPLWGDPLSGELMVIISINVIPLLFFSVKFLREADRIA